MLSLDVHQDCKRFMLCHVTCCKAVCDRSVTGSVLSDLPCCPGGAAAVHEEGRDPDPEEEAQELLQVQIQILLLLRPCHGRRPRPCLRRGPAVAAAAAPTASFPVPAPPPTAAATPAAAAPHSAAAAPDAARQPDDAGSDALAQPVHLAVSQLRGGSFPHGRNRRRRRSLRRYRKRKRLERKWFSIDIAGFRSDGFRYERGQLERPWPLPTRDDQRHGAPSSFLTAS